MLDVGKRIVDLKTRLAQRRSIKEALLLLLSSILATTVTPFALARLRDGQWSMVLLDTVIVCIMLTLFLYVFVTRRTRGAGIIMALSFMVAALLTTLLLGKSQIFWAYPALAAAFFLLGTRTAALLSVAFVSALLVLLWGALTTIELATVILSMVTIILFASSFALTNELQQSQLRHQATVDPLTGAGNRRAQTLKLDMVNAVFRRTGSPSSVLIMDVDHFKQVNDTHGHVIGDQILVNTADLIRRHTRATESLYRYGGEEFVIIAEHTGLATATELAQRLRQQIADYRFSSGVQITVSIGVAEIHRGEGRQGWLNRADGALLEAKDGGRDRVLTAPSPKVTLTAVETRGEASA